MAFKCIYCHHCQTAIDEETDEIIMGCMLLNAPCSSITAILHCPYNQEGEENI